MQSTSSNSKSKDDLTLNAKTICVGFSPSGDDKYLCVQISVKNNADSQKSFWILKCTWQCSFISDIEDIDFSMKDCPSNFPIEIKLNSHDSIIFNSILRTPVSSKKTFRIGLASMNESELMNRFRPESKTVEDAIKLTRRYLLSFKVYWSNYLTTSTLEDPIGFHRPGDDK